MPKVAVQQAVTGVLTRTAAAMSVSVGINQMVDWLEGDDMEKKIKRLIVRDGLIIFGIFAVVFLLGFWLSNTPPFLNPYRLLDVTLYASCIWTLIFYGLIWLVRLIVRAIKTLREKE